MTGYKNVAQSERGFFARLVVLIALSVCMAAAQNPPFKCSYNCCPPTGCSGEQWYANLQTNHATGINYTLGKTLPPPAVFQALSESVTLYVDSQYDSGTMAQVDTLFNELVNNEQFFNTTLQAAQTYVALHGYGSNVQQAQLQAWMNTVTPATRQAAAAAIKRYGGKVGPYFQYASTVWSNAKAPGKERSIRDPEFINPTVTTFSDGLIAVGAVIALIAFTTALPEEVVVLGLAMAADGAACAFANDLGAWDGWGGGYAYKGGELNP